MAGHCESLDDLGVVPAKVTHGVEILSGDV
jgi:hypothetical protein